MSDKPKTTLSDGPPVTPGYDKILAEGLRKGQQRAYVVLSEAERRKGFVRPLRWDPFLRAIERTEAVTPFVDPTAFLRGVDSLRAVKRLARATQIYAGEVSEVC